MIREENVINIITWNEKIMQKNLLDIFLLQIVEMERKNKYVE